MAKFTGPKGKLVRRFGVNISEILNMTVYLRDEVMVLVNTAPLTPGAKSLITRSN